MTWLNRTSTEAGPFFDDFDDIVTSPPTINTSPPTTETSGTPSSQESSLAPSWPGLNVTMSNVAVGITASNFCYQSYNTNNHSSGYQALPTESVEDKIRCITPAQFLPLINQLLLARSKGNTKPGRSTIAVALSQCDQDVYKRADVNKF
jgi:hypothetical protein